MRLVCPNCAAEYEVDRTAIPRSGRDVQCSNCGHAWFQTHPEGPGDETVSGDQHGGGPADLPDGQAAVNRAETGAQGPSGGSQHAKPAFAAPRAVDEGVLAVLREEAAREVAARRAEAAAPALETQTEMPLEPGASGSRRMARADVTPRLAAEAASDPGPDARPRSVPGDPALAASVPGAGTAPDPDATILRPRRELFPAIEEVNSTLRATSDRVEDFGRSTRFARAEPKAARGGFAQGFLSVVLFGVILLALYVFAPVISAKVPAASGLTQSYVATVDAGRLWLEGMARSLSGWLGGG